MPSETVAERAAQAGDVAQGEVGAGFRQGEVDAGRFAFVQQHFVAADDDAGRGAVGRWAVGLQGHGVVQRVGGALGKACQGAAVDGDVAGREVVAGLTQGEGDGGGLADQQVDFVGAD
eukprot:gene16102-21880_t